MQKDEQQTFHGKLPEKQVEVKVEVEFKTRTESQFNRNEGDAGDTANRANSLIATLLVLHSSNVPMLSVATLLGVALRCGLDQEPLTDPLLQTSEVLKPRRFLSTPTTIKNRRWEGNPLRRSWYNIS